MKKKLVCLLFVVALFGCQKEVETTQVTVATPSDYVASAEVPTKTSFDDAFNVLWTMDDRLSVLDHSTLNGEYKIADADAGKSNAALERIVPSGGYVAGTELSANVAYYPYAKNNSVLQETDNGPYILSVALPSSQTYVANLFGVGASPMAAVTESQEDKTLSFKNVCGVLKLQLT